MREGLPKQAKCVFKGKIFEVWQWEQKMYDGSTETFERLRRQNTAVVLAIVGDKILIQNQEQPDKPEPFPSLPGGRCEWDEKPLAAAKRELLEETGYTSEDWTLWKQQNPVGKMVWTVYTFIARNCVYAQAPQLDAGEKITTRPVTFDEFLNLSGSSRFYDKELGIELLRAQHDPKAKSDFHKLLFGKE